jgi:hypothetical protein
MAATSDIAFIKRSNAWSAMDIFRDSWGKFYQREINGVLLSLAASTRLYLLESAETSGEVDE